jgi:hypothetical protein
MLLYFEKGNDTRGKMTNGAQERRGFVRVPFKTEVEIQAALETIRSEADIDVSMSGVRVPYDDHGPEPGTMCRVSIILKASDHRLAIVASGNIIRSEHGSIAVEFTELDLDSYNHLRLLILNNTEDPERAEQEFHTHWGIRRPSL